MYRKRKLRRAPQPGMPCRNLLSSAGSNRWIFYSVKLGRLVVAYSLLEYLHLLLVEWNVGIKTFCEQPRRIQMLWAGRLVTSVLDLHILWWSGKEEYRETKYRKDLESAIPDSRVDRQIAVQTAWCSFQRAAYSIVTEEIVMANPIYLEGLRQMQAQLTSTRHLDLSSLQDRIHRLLRFEGPRRLREIEESFTNIDISHVRAATFGLIHAGRAAADIETKLLCGSTAVEAI